MKQRIQAGADSSPIYEYVADHGRSMTASIKRTSIAGHQANLTKNITSTERALIRDAVQAVQPDDTECFANALKMWEYNHRFQYAEGFAIPSDITDEPLQHAWSMLDGTKLVEVIPKFDQHYGVIISSEDILEQYTGSNFSQKGIIGNHSNRYEFLRKRGYVE